MKRIPTGMVNRQKTKCKTVRGFMYGAGVGWAERKCDWWFDMAEHRRTKRGRKAISDKNTYL